MSLFSKWARSLILRIADSFSYGVPLSESEEKPNMQTFDLKVVQAHRDYQLGFVMSQFCFVYSSLCLT